MILTLLSPFRGWWKWWNKWPVGKWCTLWWFELWKQLYSWTRTYGSMLVGMSKETTYQIPSMMLGWGSTILTIWDKVMNIMLCWLAVMCDLEGDGSGKSSDQFDVPSDALPSMDSESSFTVDQEQYASRHEEGFIQSVMPGWGSIILTIWGLNYYPAGHRWWKHSYIWWKLSSCNNSQWNTTITFDGST